MNLKGEREYMDEIVNANKLEKSNEENRLIKLTEDLLMEARDSINNGKTLSVPIAELCTLGNGVSVLVPAFNTVSQTTNIPADGLFKIVNAEIGDTLKRAGNGNVWGAMKTATGSSKMAQLAEVDSLSMTTKSVGAFNPATIMMAVALYSIEKDLAKIEKTQKKILTFLEVENESQMEADVESLMGIARNYKYNWNNELSVASSHKMIIDIQNRARKNIIVCQKKIVNTISSRQVVAAQNKINSMLLDLEKKFKYYRLSLYTFSLAALMEIMLSGNFKEEYLINVKNELETLSTTYREIFEKGSLYLEKLGNIGIEANAVKGIGIAGKVTGKLISKIPLVETGRLDEFLQDKGEHLQKNATGMKKKVVKEFAAVSNPGIRVFEEKLEDMIQIYNHTSQICFDRDKIYLLE